MRVLASSTPTTQSRRAAWEARAYRRIEWQPGDLIGDAEIVRRNEQITAAYAEMYLRDPQVYLWAGMAALTSAEVGRGMYLMRGLRLSYLAPVIGLWQREARDMCRLLGEGNLAVFADVYWQHMAYEWGGIAEIERIWQDGDLNHLAYEAWNAIDAGRRTGNMELVWHGNERLLFFEQKEVLQPRVYDGKPDLWRVLGAWIESPMPGQDQTFGDWNRGGNIGIFEQRWNWIEHSMLPFWRDLAENQFRRVERTLQDRMLGGAPFTILGVPLQQRTPTLGGRRTWMPALRAA